MKSIISTESQEQSLLIQWWRVACKGYKLPEEVLFHIPNEGKRGYKTVSTLKGIGLRSGIPDLFLAVMNKEYGGLFIEMKRVKGSKVRDSQYKAIAILSDQGYQVSICYGAEDAIETIKEYLERC